jgi:hypothetical protein
LHKLIALMPALPVECPWAVDALELDSTTDPDLPLN